MERRSKGREIELVSKFWQKQRGINDNHKGKRSGTRHNRVPWLEPTKEKAPASKTLQSSFFRDLAMFFWRFSFLASIFSFASISFASLLNERTKLITGSASNLLPARSTFTSNKHLPLTCTTNKRKLRKTELSTRWRCKQNPKGFSRPKLKFVPPWV